MQGRGNGHHQDAVAQLGQPVQAGDALGDDVLVGREQVVGQGLPVGKRQHWQLGREELQFLLQAVGGLAVCRQ